MEENKNKQVILIVDDSLLVRKMIASTLKNKYKILLAEDGESALDIINAGTQQIDMVLLDIIMPGMGGYGVCKRLQEKKVTSEIPIIFLTGITDKDEETKGLEAGGVDFLLKPINPSVLLARIETHLALVNQKKLLEDIVSSRTKELMERTRELIVSKRALQEALKNLQTTEVTTGVYYIQVPEEGVNILCGCPADIVKHLMAKGYITKETRDGVSFETGPNVILLSDVLIQNGKFSNLAEFPVFQMLYRQGLHLPGHPNNNGDKPILLGSKEQIDAQMNYIYRGNYGLISEEEMMEAGINKEDAEGMMYIKLKFKGDGIKPSEDFLDTLVIDKEKIEVKNGIYVKRTGFNKFAFEYKDKTTEIDLNLYENETYTSPYNLGYHDIRRQYFAIIHSGEGDGWDIHRQSMSSILIYQGDIYLIDACPNIFLTLTSLGIDVSEIKGIFHTHAHDDHFAGLPTIMQSDHRIKYFATPLVRASVTKKLSALMSIEESKFSEYFDVCDLEFDTWNDFDGLEVKPIFSPHPLETNMFVFRIIEEDGYKTYAHYADIVSLELFKDMMKDSPFKGKYSSAFYQTVKENYLTPVTLKKIDAGGGMIHGVATDFKSDKSNKIILAHTSESLTSKQKEIGSQATFGSVDVISSVEQDYKRRLAHMYLNAFFPNIHCSKLRSLLNAQLHNFNAGSIIRKRGEKPDYIYLILTGSVEYIHPDSNIVNKLTVGSFIGIEYIFSENIEYGTWRAISHVTVQKIHLKFFCLFLERNNLYTFAKNLYENISFLQKTFLFGQECSYTTLNNVGQTIKKLELNKGDKVNINKRKMIVLIAKGKLSIKSSKSEKDEIVIGSGDFFGEHSFFSDDLKEFSAEVIEKGEAFYIDKYPLLEIPIVQWKMTETYAKRKKVFDL
ncbi:MAG: response regulator [Nitrospinae bacterium]|nr:response regulator [Nitrospinota bacterium]